jgi:glycosyltransferase involved in cell wall biosynthesis
MLRFAAALSDGLRAAGMDVTLVRPEPFFGRLRPNRSGLGKWLGYLDKFLLFPPRLRRLARRADLVHICDHSNAMYVPDVATRPLLLTCNDLLAIRSALGEFPQNRTGWTGRLLQRWILSGLRQARRLTCISEATQRDVLRLSAHPASAVTVTHMGQNFAYAPVSEVTEAAAARRFGRPFDAAAFQRHGLPAGPYILHVGGSQWYKNRAGVFAMHAELQARPGASTPQLVVVGPPPYAPGVEARTGVDNSALAALYSGAELLLFPSLEEGFGWPIIEAQACGCRVLTTGKPPMTEVGGNAAFYLSDPTDARAGAEMMAKLLAQDEAACTAESLAGTENAARFSTERMVSEYLSIYRELLSP